MSKIAALAAKRRQKENEKALAERSGKAEAQEKQIPTFSSSHKHQHSSPELLDERSRKDGPETHNVDCTKEIPTIAPISDGVGCEPQLPTAEARVKSLKQSASLGPATAIRASPSPFAATIVAQDLTVVGFQSSLANDFASAMSFNNPRAKPFDFTDPSPDDVVTKAQSSKGSN